MSRVFCVVVNNSCLLFDDGNRKKSDWTDVERIFSDAHFT